MKSFRCYSISLFGIALIFVTSVVQAQSYTFLTKWGAEGTMDGQFSSPTGVAVDGSGNVYVADRLNHRIQVFRPIVLPTVYVDFATGSPAGTGEMGDPVDSLGVALTIVEVDGLIKINAGSSSETALIDTAVTIERNGSTGTVTIGAPARSAPESFDARGGFVSRGTAGSFTP